MIDAVSLYPPFLRTLEKVLNEILKLRSIALMRSGIKDLE